VVAIYKALKEQRHKARVMADRAADAAQQLAEAQRRLDIVNSAAAAAAPAANGAPARQRLCRRGLRLPSTLVVVHAVQSGQFRQGRRHLQGSMSALQRPHHPH